MTTRWLGIVLALAAIAIVATTFVARGADSSDQWRTYAGTNASAKYAPLGQIDRNTVKNLRVAWRQSSMPAEIRRGRPTVSVPTNYQVTPLMVEGMLYATAGDGSVLAMNPGTGAVVWSYVPPELLKNASQEASSQPSEVLGGRSANRGLAYWTDGAAPRVITISRRSLIALHAKTGAPVGDFGGGGTVDLSQGYRRPAVSFRWTSVPLIVKDLIIVGGTGNGADGHFVPGDIRAFDVRTGKLTWTFNVVPDFVEVGNDTWLRDSYAYSGAAGVWGLMSADDELGYVYIATETPSSRGGDFWGGQRPGNNLFAESLVCLDARTGKRVWHFQAVHHGIWDYDFNAAPNLIDITRRLPHQGDRRGVEAGVCVCARSRDGPGCVADRGASSAARRSARRVVRADATVPDETAGVRPARREDRRPD